MRPIASNGESLVLAVVEGADGGLFGGGGVQELACRGLMLPLGLEGPLPSRSTRCSEGRAPPTSRVGLATRPCVFAWPIRGVASLQDVLWRARVVLDKLRGGRRELGGEHVPATATSVDRGELCLGCSDLERSRMLG